MIYPSLEPGLMLRADTEQEYAIKAQRYMFFKEYQTGFFVLGLRTFDPIEEQVRLTNPLFDYTRPHVDGRTVPMDTTRMFPHINA